MTVNKFAGMDAEDIAFNLEHPIETPAEVDAFFNDLRLLDADKISEIADIAEQRAIGKLSDMVDDKKVLLQYLPPSLATYKEPWTGTPDLLETQKDCQVLLHVSQLKGEAADPLTKAIVHEVTQLSPEEYNSQSALISAVIKASDSLSASPPKASAKLDEDEIGQVTLESILTQIDTPEDMDAVVDAAFEALSNSKYKRAVKALEKTLILQSDSFDDPAFAQARDKMQRDISKVKAAQASKPPRPRQAGPGM